jgi:phage terminase large subunit-like protein
MPVHAHTRHRYRARNAQTTPPPPSPDVLAARERLGHFGWYVCGKTPAAHHEQWFPHLVPGTDSEELVRIAGENLNILAPRGSAKSTWLAIFCAWALGHNPGAQIIYVGYSESVALKQSRIVKRIIESAKYQRVFPHIRPGVRWSDRDWEIDKAHAGVNSLDSDYSFYAVGITGAITSRRASLIVCDDLIKSSAAIANEEIRQKMVLNWQEVLEPTLIPGGRVVSIGTRFRRDDIHCTEFTPDNEWRVVVQGAIVERDGEKDSYWPERFTLAKLLKIQKKNPIVFTFQYQNILPPNSEDAIILPEWITYAVVPKKGEFDDLVLGVDLAASEKTRSDYTALVLVGRKGDLFYVLEAIRFRAIGNLEKIKAVLELRKRWGGFRVAFEKVAYQSSFEGDWRDEVVKRRRINDLRIEAYIPRGDKDARLEGISGVFANNLVRFNRDRPMNELVDEVLRLNLEHDDMSDGLEIALSRLQRRSKKTLSAA